MKTIRITDKTELSEQHKAKQREFTYQTNLAQTRFDLDQSASESTVNGRKKITVGWNQNKTKTKKKKNQRRTCQVYTTFNTQFSDAIKYNYKYKLVQSNLEYTDILPMQIMMK